MKINDQGVPEAAARIITGYGSQAARQYVKRRDERLKEHGITPTIEACLAYDLGRASVLSAEAIESQINETKERE